jgi:hypothetical protein
VSEARIAAPVSVPEFPSLDGPARIELKPPGPATGFVDGAWWPHSNDLARESVPLIATIAPLRGQTLRVSYDMDAWTNVEHAVVVDGVRVHLDGFRGRSPDRVLLTDKNNHSLTLLVIPPTTDAPSATDSMRRASAGANVEDTDVLLAPALPGHTVHGLPEGIDGGATEWETDGGFTLRATVRPDSARTGR